MILLLYYRFTLDYYTPVRTKLLSVLKTTDSWGRWLPRTEWLVWHDYYHRERRTVWLASVGQCCSRQAGRCSPAGNEWVGYCWTPSPRCKVGEWPHWGSCAGCLIISPHQTCIPPAAGHRSKRKTYTCITDSDYEAASSKRDQGTWKLSYATKIWFNIFTIMECIFLHSGWSTLPKCTVSSMFISVQLYHVTIM